MDAPEQSDFETSDSAPKAKAKASARRAAAAQVEPETPPEEQEQIESAPEPKEQDQVPTPVEMYAITAPIYRDIRIAKLARQDRDVLWLVEEVARLKKELEAK